MAEALEEKIRALSDAQARERRFTSDVAHELRTPLTALAAEAALLTGNRSTALPARRDGATVARRGRSLAAMVEGWEISRLDVGREDVRMEPVDLGALAAGVLRSRSWDTSVSLDAEPIVVETDRRRAERVVSNLIENAVAHSGRDVAVRVGRDGTGAIVEVGDRGPGIAPKHLPHALRSATKPASALGQGQRAGARDRARNARLLGGRIDAWSEVGAGSRFTLTLPVAKPLRGGRGAGCSRERR